MNNYNKDEIIMYEVKKNNNLKKKIATVFTCCILSTGSLGLGYAVGSNSNFQNQKVSAQEVALISTVSSQNETVKIINDVSDAVVSINTKQYAQTRFGNYVAQPSAGSGIIIHEDNEKIYIVTNDHVIDNATEVNISIDDVNNVPAKYVGSNSNSDIAVISVLKSELKTLGIENYKIAKFADSTKLQVGEDVIAIGNAAGEGKSATKGIISALNKEITIDGKTLSVLQTDAAINPGNSGGALVNSSGLIVGVNTAKFSSSMGIEGIGYSIPSNNVKEIVEGIITSPQKTTNQNSVSLGVQSITITKEIADYYNLPIGVYIENIIPGSSAFSSGLTVGDIILKFNGVTVASNEELIKEIAKIKQGDEIPLSIYRNGKTIETIKVKFDTF